MSEYSYEHINPSEFLAEPLDDPADYFKKNHLSEKTNFFRSQITSAYPSGLTDIAAALDGINQTIITEKLGVPLIESAVINSAKIWIKLFYNDIAESDWNYWIHPHVTPDEDGDILFEWWNDNRKLSVYIGLFKAYYLMVEQKECIELTDGNADSKESRIILWTWLIKQED